MISEFCMNTTHFSPPRLVHAMDFKDTIVENYTSPFFPRHSAISRVVIPVAFNVVHRPHHIRVCFKQLCRASYSLFRLGELGCAT